MTDQPSSSPITSAAVADIIVNVSPATEPQDMAQSSEPSFGSIEQYSDLVLKYAAIVLNEAEKKGKEYPTINMDVLDLLDTVAHMNAVGRWFIWRSWMHRHLLPVIYMSSMNENEIDLDIMERRLIDLLGYVFMGLQLVEKGRKDKADQGWEAFRDLAQAKQL